MSTGFLQKIEHRYAALGAGLCVGLDPVIEKLPQGFAHNPKGIFKFLRLIVEATQAEAVAYKPNLAFFEALGSEGRVLLEKVLGLIPDGIAVVLDAKRGDIGSSSEQYAASLFDDFGADAVTVSPYMGVDSLEPFLNYPDRGVFILGLTSNPGRADVQLLKLADGRYVFQAVMDAFRAKPCVASRGWVVGATLGDLSTQAMQSSGSDPVLVPGIGAQGGDLETVLASAAHKNPAHVLINASRSILFASSGADFAEAAMAEASSLRQSIATAWAKMPSRAK